MNANKYLILLISILANSSFANIEVIDSMKNAKIKYQNAYYQPKNKEEKIYFYSIKTNPSNINLYWKNKNNESYSTFYSLKKHLTKESSEPFMMMNAGIYSSNKTPAGLFVENNKIIAKLNTLNGKGNFHLQPNGIFYINNNNQAKLTTTSKFVEIIKKSNIKTAIQSGPMLVINNKINSIFKKDSNSLYVRNAVCVDKSNSVVFFISKDKTNFYNFANIAVSLDCKNALYLDGSISKIYVKGKINNIFHFNDFVGIFTIE